MKTKRTGRQIAADGIKHQMDVIEKKIERRMAKAEELVEPMRKELATLGSVLESLAAPDGDDAGLLGIAGMGSNDEA